MSSTVILTDEQITKGYESYMKYYGKKGLNKHAADYLASKWANRMRELREKQLKEVD